jgi:hypothetical protein
VQKNSKKVDRTDCEIIMFAYAWQGLQTLTARGVKILNYETLSFCTIVMHIMLGTCVPNIRGR